ncbi:MAG: hypothetical protein JWM80_1557, partial [Cyanobacteria bacterium RYN_339]|nr:hypothetical protein [Cyanobacteria bacterium RYN_339]
MADFALMRWGMSANGGVPGVAGNEPRIPGNAPPVFPSPYQPNAYVGDPLQQIALLQQQLMVIQAQLNALIGPGAAPASVPSYYPPPAYNPAPAYNPTPA